MPISQMEGYFENLYYRFLEEPMFFPSIFTVYLMNYIFQTSVLIMECI